MANVDIHNKFLAWRVYRDISAVDRSPDEKRLGITFGLLSVNNAIISVTDVEDGGELNISRKESFRYPNDYNDVFLDLQANKFLYAKITLSTNAVELEYSSSPPFGAGAIEILADDFQRIPLAFITEQEYIVDLRPIGGGGGTGATVEPFTIDLTIERDDDGNPTSGTYTLWPGTVNETMPSNMLNTFDYTVNTTSFIKLTVTTNGKSVTGISIVAAGSHTGNIDANSGAAPTTFDILIGVIVNNTLYQVRTGNITATNTEAIREGKATPVPGTSPYNFYYTWVIDS